MGPLLRARGLPASAVQQPTVTVDAATLRAICDDLAVRLGDPDLGLHVAIENPRGTYGVVEFALRNAPTLREALQRIVRYQRLVNDLVELHLRPCEEGSAYVVRFQGEPLGAGRHGNVYSLAVPIVAGREITGQRWAVRRAWLAHTEPRDVSALADFLGTERIDHGADHNSLEIADEVLELPVTSADPALLSVMDRVAPLLAPTATTGDSVAARTRDTVRAMLGTAAPGLDAVARRMGLSGRTLQRSLASAGTTYQRVLDEARRELVTRLLIETSLSLDEIAARAGYAEVRALKRSFRRWTGSTPSRWKSRADRAPES